MSSVKKATDTSEVQFPAPSHVSLPSQAAEIAKQVTDFYTNSDSMIKLTEDMKVELRDEIDRKVKTIPDIDMSQHPSVTSELPDEFRLGDNPLFNSGGKK